MDKTLFVDQTGPNQGDHTSETSEDSSISSLGSSFSFASHSTGLNDGFRTPDITGTQPSPDSDPCQDNVINYTHILERNLNELRSEQHRRWKEQKERDISFSKSENDREVKINPDYYLMETLNHTNRLIANLDVSGLVNLLRHQIYKNEELHRTIEEKNDLIQSLQHKIQSLEESSKTDFKHVQNLRIARSQSNVNSKSDTSERNIWTKPKTTVKIHFLLPGNLFKLRIALSFFLSPTNTFTCKRKQASLPRATMFQSTSSRRTLDCRGKSSICKVVSQIQHQ